MKSGADVTSKSERSAMACGEQEWSASSKKAAARATDAGLTPVRRCSFHLLLDAELIHQGAKAAPDGLSTRHDIPQDQALGD